MMPIKTEKSPLSGFQTQLGTSKLGFGYSKKETRGPAVTSRKGEKIVYSDVELTKEQVNAIWASTPDRVGVKVIDSL